jgi:hypothetical protein
MSRLHSDQIRRPQGQIIIKVHLWRRAKKSFAFSSPKSPLATVIATKPVRLIGAVIKYYYVYSSTIESLRTNNRHKQHKSYEISFIFHMMCLRAFPKKLFTFSREPSSNYYDIYNYLAQLNDIARFGILYRVARSGLHC